MAVWIFSFRESEGGDHYQQAYHSGLSAFVKEQQGLLRLIRSADLNSEAEVDSLRKAIHAARRSMKAIDFWTRYLDPVAQKQINGPLPVEWETEVFEKFERPYLRRGAGLSLAEMYLDEAKPQKDSLLNLIDSAGVALNTFRSDTVLQELQTFHHFFLCNRLYLLNLASIYTTGFECPDTSRIISELREMMVGVRSVYTAYNLSFPSNPLPEQYLKLYDSALLFVQSQPSQYSRFDHFTFLQQFINPLFAANADLLQQYGVVSHNLGDYSLNKRARSIFSKDLYRGQNTKGIFLRVKDSASLALIEELGRSLFFDPVLSGNNQRSCASCHKPAEFFTDTSFATALKFSGSGRLDRNTPSLINAEFNHLLMADGKHFSLQHQAEGVIFNPDEMSGDSLKVLEKVLQIPKYREGFEQLLAFTPQSPDIGLEHIVSAITFYYASFSKNEASFDRAMNSLAALPTSAKHGFNLFMSKAQCGTCHFPPQFNGVKPPYVSSEFEVLGVPDDQDYKHLSSDSGRARVNPAFETLRAFRTPTLRNVARTAPYMHNGVFRSLDEVLDFYNGGGGLGHGLKLDNQTLSADSLRLNKTEMALLIHFMESLNEDVKPDPNPKSLPRSHTVGLNTRKVGGNY